MQEREMAVRLWLADDGLEFGDELMAGRVYHRSRNGLQQVFGRLLVAEIAPKGLLVLDSFS